MDGNVAGTVQDPAEYGRFPEACLSHERCRRNGMPDNVDVQKALVVSDDDVVYALWNVFCPLDCNLNAKKLENDVPEGERANLGAVFPMPADTAIEGVGDTRNNHNGENDDVIKECKNSAHGLCLLKVNYDPLNINRSLWA